LPFALYPFIPIDNTFSYPKEAETSESEADEEMLQLTLGVKDCNIEFQEKLAVTEAEFLSMPFDPHGRIPSTKWPLEKSIGYEGICQEDGEATPKAEGASGTATTAGEDRLQTQSVAESPTSVSNRPFSTGQYARKTGVPARGILRTTRIRVSKTV
jgi:hypothetical protein